MNDLNKYLDAAILKAEFTRDEVIDALKACIKLKTFSVCVRPCDIELAQENCKGTETAVCVVLGFPHGDQLTTSKADEAKRYIDLGVDEIDMVANYGWVKSGQWDLVKADIEAVTKQTKAAGVISKVIFETAQIEDEHIKKLVEICIEADADFIKTSTGFNGDGATVENVQLMLDTAAGRIKVKPSGGIRNTEGAQKFVDMGAHRLGLSWNSCESVCKGSKPTSTSGY
ncbi:MAG: deoxyribose-phosphate aldolase [Lentimonas sp.]